MKALLDTNIIIGREASTIINQDIGILFKWLDKTHYQKCIHRVCIDEIEKNPNKSTVDTFKIKMNSYEILETTAKMSKDVKEVSNETDQAANDIVDTLLLNELYNRRVDILITEDKKIHLKADKLNISDKVFTINSFLEYIYSEYPDLIDYKVLSVEKVRMGDVDIEDAFFDSLKSDYRGFELWFNKKANEPVYITKNKSNNKLLSFLYLKIEDENENYKDIQPAFQSKKRLKIGTFKVVSNGVRLGERFLKIIFDNALLNKVDEIYVSIFDKRDEQRRLITLLEEWGFIKYGIKGSDGELIYVRDFSRVFDNLNPKKNYPFISSNNNIFFIPIYPEYHTELIPDSILHNENIENFKDSKPHSNALSKVYISRSTERGIDSGDILIFYRTGGFFKSVITTIAVVEGIHKDFRDFEDFRSKSKKRSVLSDEKIMEYWNYSHIKPFLINFLYTYSFPIRINLKKLIEMGIIKDMTDAPRGLRRITKRDFNEIIKETNSKTDYIIN